MDSPEQLLKRKSALALIAKAEADMIRFALDLPHTPENVGGLVEIGHSILALETLRTRLQARP